MWSHTSYYLGTYIIIAWYMTRLIIIEEWTTKNTQVKNQTNGIKPKDKSKSVWELIDLGPTRMQVGTLDILNREGLS